MRWGILCSVLLITTVVDADLRAQCDPTVPTFVVDLSYSPTATYLSPPVQRQDYCCGVTAPDQCVQFILTLHPDAVGIIFNICSGAIPSGSMFYQLACGPPVAVGTPLCLSGAGPHVITFCKPGNNVNEYCITSLGPPVAGQDIVVNDGCTGTLSSYGFDPTTVSWTSITPGAPGAYDFYLGCDTCTTTTVTPTVGYPPYVDFVICGAALGACGNTPNCDTARVYFNSTLATAIVPTFPTVCYGAAGTTITALASGGTPPYTYTWNTGASTASIFVGAGTYTVFVGDTSDCPPAMATVVVTQFMQPITAQAGSDILVCGNNFPVQLNGAVTGASGGQWSGGAGSFLPSNAVLNATYQPTPSEIATGWVQLTLTTTGNGTCPSDQDVVMIIFSNALQGASASSTDASCNGGADGTATALPASPGYSFLWDDPSAQNTNVATGLQAGTYHVQITEPLGCDTILTVTINSPAAIAVASMNVIDESCAGNNDGSITVSASGGTPPYSYSWNTGDTTAMIIAGAGTYSVSVTDANGCAPANGVATINALAQPSIANAGPDWIACMNTLPFTVSGSGTYAMSGSWSGGSGTFIGGGWTVDYQPTAAEVAAGGVDLYLTAIGAAACPQDVDTVHVSISNIFLSAAVTSTSPLCAGGSTGTATFSPTGPGFTYSWNDPAGQTTPTATGLAAGTYQITVTDATGCDTTMSVLVTDLPQLAITSLSATDASCNAGSDGTATVTASGGTPGYTYSWSPNAGGQTTPSISNLSAGSYTVNVTDAHGCTVNANVNVGQPMPLTLSAQIPDTVCVNTTVQLTAMAGGGTAPYTIAWSGIGIGDTVNWVFGASQTVSVTVVDYAGCTGPTISVPVYMLNLNTAVFSAYGDTTVCPGGFATIGASLTGYPSSVQILWPTVGLFGTGPHVIGVTGDQVVPVTVTDGCGNMLSDQVVLDLKILPVITLPPLIAEGCAPLVVTMPDLGITDPVSYVWHFGDGMASTDAHPTHTYLAGTYWVTLTVTTPAGCNSSATSPGQVIAYPIPDAAFTADPWSTDIDHPTIAFTDGSSGAVTSYDWSFGDGSGSTDQDPTHAYTALGTFNVQLVVEGANGCMDSVSHMVTITPVYDIVIPNVFTPNPNGGNGGLYDPNDLSNDIFYPFVRFVQDFNMRIYNRWGELVFESQDLSIGWDGYYRSQPSQQDAYAYQVWVRFVDGKERKLMGDVTLLR